MTTHISFIVNPRSQGGLTGKTWEDTFTKIKRCLGPQFDVIDYIADGIGQGVRKTKKAVQNGTDLVIAVGGEGTANEVLNGLLQSTETPKLGFIRAGTVNDYLQTIGWPASIESQVEIIKNQNYVTTPILKVSGVSEKYGINVADIGIGAKIAYMASVERRLTWIRGPLRYQLLSLGALFDWENISAEVIVDDRTITGDLSLLTGGFSYSVGAYNVHPHANPFGNKLAYTIAMDFSRWQMFTKMKMLKNGQHHNDMEDIYMGHTSKIEIYADEPLLLEVDGEPFSQLSDYITIKAVPNAVEILKV